jgi:Tol biopolymer transport system component
MTGSLVACSTASLPPSASPSAQAIGSAAVASPTPEPSESVVVGEGEEWLAFQWLDDTGEGIFLARPDGSGKHQLVPDLAGSEIHPDWSPDGERIAFVRFTPEGLSELWVVNADGSGEERLLTCDLPCNSFGFPDWGADGTAIFFGQDANAPTAGGVPTTFQVARLDLATGEASVLLTREGGLGVEQPRVSQDGQHVVFTRFREPDDAFAGSAIFVSDLSGGSDRQLTDWDIYAAYPDWSADDLIVFNTFDLGAFQVVTTAVNLYTIRPDGSDIHELTDYGEFDTRATQPRWAPDGSGIVYTQVSGSGFGTRTAAFLPLDGGESPWAGFDPIIATHPTLRPL